MSGGLIATLCLGAILFITAWLILARLIRQQIHFPIPYFLVHLIDNPFRRMIQPLHKAPEELGLKPGMTVLEIGPGGGSYTLTAARHIGPGGHLVALDIESRVVAHIQKRMQQQDVGNVNAQQGDAQVLEFPAVSFDAIYAITVYGEIPDRAKALSEFHRVLVPGGTLAISEFLLDPDSQPYGRVRAEGESAGFIFIRKTGNLLYYTLLFEKPRPAEEASS